MSTGAVPTRRFPGCFALTRSAGEAHDTLAPARTLTLFTRSLPIFAILVPLLMLSGAAWLNWRDAWSDADLAMRRSAESGAEYAARTLESYTVAVGRINDRLSGSSDDEIRANERSLHLHLQSVLREIPQANFALVLDRDGVPLVGSAYPVDRSARHDTSAYFTALQRAVPPTVHIGQATLSEESGEVSFSVSRRRSRVGNPDGTPGDFAGVTLISIGANAVAQGLGRLLTVHGDALALVHDDGAVLAASTVRPEHAQPATIEGPYAAAVEGRGPTVFEMNPSPWMAATALAATRPVAGFRIHALAMRPRAEIVDAWLDSMVGHVAFALPAALMLLLLSLQVRRDQLRLTSLNQGLHGDVARGMERLRRAEEIGMIGTFEFDTRTGANVRSAEYMSVHGLPPIETRERHEDWARRLHPEDREKAEAHVLATLADPTQHEYSQTYRIVTPGGEVRWILSRGRIERDAAGRPTFLRGAHLDVTQLRAAELALADTDARLRLAQEAVGIGAWEWVPSTRTLSCSRKMLELWGLAPGGSPGLEDILAAVDVADRPGFQALVEDIRPGARFRCELRVRRSLGDGPAQTIWVAVRASLLEADPLAPARMIGVAYDITERKRSDELATMMAHEVEHRAKNALMVVSSLLRMTKAETIQDFATVMDGRVRALSRTMGLLGQGRWRGAGLNEIVESEIGHFNRGDPGEARTIELSGPAVMIDVDAAQPLSMALHELATNAAKYGALSVAAGTLRVVWSVEDGMVNLRWEERGGPRLDGPPAHNGFGSNLITMLVEGQLQGSVKKHWGANGLACLITFPLPPPR